MPELPEVETVRRILTREVKGRTITAAEIYYDRLIKSDIDVFKREIVGRTIEDIGRKGKFLVFSLSDGYALIVHLRMEGKFFHLQGLEANLDKHTSLVFALDDGSFLFFKDTRKFGVMILKKMENAYAEAPLSEVGPEPFEITDPAYLQKAFGRTGKPLKEALLDQTVMCGLGNIYADETLFRAELSPFMRADQIGPEDSGRLISSARDILTEAIESGGSTIKSYHPAEGMSGLFQNRLDVYGREGQKCRRCNTVLKKRFVGGRGTTFCPHCQHVPYSVGLTGEIAAGKSTVLAIFKELGANVFSADEEVTKLYENQKFVAELAVRFPEVITDGKVDKSIVLKSMNESKAFKSRYERFVWSALKERVNDFLVSSTDALQVLEIPLLFEARYDHLFSFTIGVESEKATERLQEREGGESDLKSRLASSNRYNENRHKLDFIIDNNGTTDELRRKVEEIYKTLTNK